MEPAVAAPRQRQVRCRQSSRLDLPAHRRHCTGSPWRLSATVHLGDRRRSWCGGAKARYGSRVGTERRSRPGTPRQCVYRPDAVPVAERGRQAGAGQPTRPDRAQRNRLAQPCTDACRRCAVKPMARRIQRPRAGAYFGAVEENYDASFLDAMRRLVDM